MFAQIQRPNQHFNAYYQDNFLLIQFVIAEFVLTHRLLDHVKHLTENSLQSTQHLEESVQPLFHALSQLLGSLSNHDHLSISRWSKGPLTKMKDYCEQFSRNHPVDKTHFNLQTMVYQTWLAAIHNLELISTFHLCRSMSKNPSFASHILRALKGLQARLNIITKQIPRVVNLYWDNENVVYFLIRRKEDLNAIYGVEWADKLFKPYAKRATLTPLLIRRYKERGFDNLLSLQEEEVYC